MCINYNCSKVFIVNKSVKVKNGRRSGIHRPLYRLEFYVHSHTVSSSYHIKVNDTVPLICRQIPTKVFPDAERVKVTKCGKVLISNYTGSIVSVDGGVVRQPTNESFKGLACHDNYIYQIHSNTGNVCMYELQRNTLELVQEYSDSIESQFLCTNSTSLFVIGVDPNLMKVVVNIYDKESKKLCNQVKLPLSSTDNVTDACVSSNKMILQLATGCGVGRYSLAREGQYLIGYLPEEYCEAITETKDSYTIIAIAQKLNVIYPKCSGLFSIHGNITPTSLAIDPVKEDLWILDTECRLFSLPKNLYTPPFSLLSLCLSVVFLQLHELPMFLLPVNLSKLFADWTNVILVQVIIQQSSVHHSIQLKVKSIVPTFVIKKLISKRSILYDDCILYGRRKCESNYKEIVEDNIEIHEYQLKYIASTNKLPNNLLTKF